MFWNELCTLDAFAHSITTLRKMSYNYNGELENILESHGFFNFKYFRFKLFQNNMVYYDFCFYNFQLCSILNEI